MREPFTTESGVKGGISVSQRQLAQLRDMGISDEAAARQALMVTGGDLQAALDILFGGS